MSDDLNFFHIMMEQFDADEVYGTQQRLFYPGETSKELAQTTRDFGTLLDVQNYLKSIASSDFVCKHWPCAAKHADTIFVKHFNDAPKYKHEINLDTIMAAVEPYKGHHFLFNAEANHAMKTVVALHELAHWIKFYQPSVFPENAHGPQYRWILARLVGEFIPTEEGRILMNVLMSREMPVQSIDCPKAA